MSTELTTFLGYCPKCKEQKNYHGIITSTDSNRLVALGECPVCSSTIRKILGKQSMVSA